MKRDTPNQTTSIETKFHESDTFMDYLHGDLDDEEAYLACLYEYARESKAIWEAARERDKWKVEGLDWFTDEERTVWKTLDLSYRIEKAALTACEALQLSSPTSFSFQLTCFLVCESFPKKDWNLLTPAERKAITRFERKKVPPLPMTDVFTLKAHRVFDEFNEMAEKARPVIENVPPGKQAKPMQLVWPILHKWESISYAVFNVDYSKSETQMVNEFREWLRSPENRARLEKHKKPSTGTTGGAKDRLKDLAAWRLYREFDNDWERANQFADKHRKVVTRYETATNNTKETPRPFHNAKGQEGKPSNQAALFGEDADARKSKKRVLDYCREIMPREFRRFRLSPTLEKELRRAFT